jgi:hypothetical protein
MRPLPSSLSLALALALRKSLSLSLRFHASMAVFSSGALMTLNSFSPPSLAQAWPDEDLNPRHVGAVASMLPAASHLPVHLCPASISTLFGSC